MDRGWRLVADRLLKLRWTEYWYKSKDEGYDEHSGRQDVTSFSSTQSESQS